MWALQVCGDRVCETTPSQIEVGVAAELFLGSYAAHRPGEESRYCAHPLRIDVEVGESL
jgi:hypothetical protein